MFLKDSFHCLEDCRLDGGSQAGRRLLLGCSRRDEDLGVGRRVGEVGRRRLELQELVMDPAVGEDKGVENRRSQDSWPYQSAQETQ